MSDSHGLSAWSNVLVMLLNLSQQSPLQFHVPYPNDFVQDHYCYLILPTGLHLRPEKWTFHDSSRRLHD